MSGWPDSGGLFPEWQIEDRHDADDRHEPPAPCDHYRAMYSTSKYCRCGVLRGVHFAQLVEANGLDPYATLLEGRRKS